MLVLIPLVVVVVAVAALTNHSRRDSLRRSLRRWLIRH